MWMYLGYFAYKLNNFSVWLIAAQIRTFAFVLPRHHIALHCSALSANNTLAINNLLFIMCSHSVVCVQYLWWKSNLPNKMLAKTLLSAARIFSFSIVFGALFSLFAFINHWDSRIGFNGFFIVSKRLTVFFRHAKNKVHAMFVLCQIWWPGTIATVVVDWPALSNAKYCLLILAALLWLNYVHIIIIYVQ